MNRIVVVPREREGRCLEMRYGVSEGTSRDGVPTDDASVCGDGLCELVQVLNASSKQRYTVSSRGKQAAGMRSGSVQSRSGSRGRGTHAVAAPVPVPFPIPAMTAVPSDMVRAGQRRAVPRRDEGAGGEATALTVRVGVRFLPSTALPPPVLLALGASQGW